MSSFGCSSTTPEGSGFGGATDPGSNETSSGFETTSVGTTDQVDAGTTDEQSDSTSTGAEDETGDPPAIFDLGVPDVPETMDCEVPTSVPCDHLDDDPWHAIGLNCDGGPQVLGTQDGDEDAFHVHEGNIGTYIPAPYPPQHGDKVLLMSTGDAADLLIPGASLTSGIQGTLAELPAPIDPMNVSNVSDCTDNPSLIGTGDCSNSLQAQLDQGYNIWDYAEMRFATDVPEGASALSFQFVFWSSEYPWWYQTSYNDMFVAWLESEQWTGNVSFDEQGNPISINAAFLDYKDHYNEVDCPTPCEVPQEAPELGGTAMEGHGGTKWLTTTAPVSPGEQIEVVFALFDVSDSYLDSIVAIDNVQWTCDGGPPVTTPEG